MRGSKEAQRFGATRNGPLVGFTPFGTPRLVAEGCPAGTLCDPRGLSLSHGTVRVSLHGDADAGGLGRCLAVRPVVPVTRFGGAGCRATASDCSFVGSLIGLGITVLSSRSKTSSPRPMRRGALFIYAINRTVSTA